MSKQKKEFMVNAVINALQEKTTFDLSDIKSNPEKFTTIHEMILWYLLRNESSSRRMKKFVKDLPKYANAFYPALNKLEDAEIEHYHFIPKGERNIQFVTLDKNYRKAQRRDTKRGKDNIKVRVIKLHQHLKLNNPKELPPGSVNALEG